MAHATHLTIGTADRIRLDARQRGPGRENEEGEDEVRQEVQVSITYALEAGDTDLVRLAEAKAVEVQRAHEAVWNRIGAFSGNPQCRGGSDQAGSEPGRRTFHPDGEEEDKEEEENDSYFNENHQDVAGSGDRCSAGRCVAHHGLVTLFYLCRRMNRRRLIEEEEDDSYFNEDDDDDDDDAASSGSAV